MSRSLIRVRSEETSKLIESTAIAVLCWLKDSKYLFNAGNGVKYLQEGLVLKAIVAYDKSALEFLKEGSVLVKIDGNEVSSVEWSKIER